MRRWLIVIGVLVMVYAVVGAVADLGGKVGGVLIFLVAVLVVHDAIWLPLVSVIGRHVRTRVAAIVATALTVTTVPLVLGLGRTADNPSALPLHYGRNLSLILLGTAVVTGIEGARRKKWPRREANDEGGT